MDNSKDNIGQITIDCVCGKSFNVFDEVDFHYQFKVGYHKCPFCGYEGKLRNPLAVFDS